MPAHHAIERRHALLAVEQELHYAGRERSIAPMRSRLGFRRPDQQTADRMPAIKRIEQAADLIAVPDIAPLKFGQGHMAAVDVVEDRRDLHAPSPSINCLFRSIAVSIALIFWFRSTRWLICLARPACAPNWAASRASRACSSSAARRRSIGPLSSLTS